MSAHSLLYSRVVSPRYLSVSRYVMLLIVWTSFVALLCAFSIATMSFLKRGVYTVTAYSKWGRTMDFYKLRNISLSIYANVLKMMPRLRFALLIILLICSLKFKAFKVHAHPSLFHLKSFLSRIVLVLISLCMYKFYS